MGSKEMQQWIGAVDRIQSPTRPTREEMLAVARDVGLDESVLDQAAQQAQTLRVQGRKFLDKSMPGEAVAAFEEALSLEPWSFETLQSLGEAYLARYRKTGSDADAQDVERIARRLIHDAADHDAGYKLLKAIGARPRSSLWPWISGALAIGLIASLAWGLTRSNAPATTATGAGNGTAGLPPAEQVGDLPVRVLAGKLPPGVTMEITEVEKTDTNGGEGWILSLGAIVHNDADVALEQVLASVTAYDAAGERLTSADLSVVEDHTPGVYRGEQSGEQVYLRSTTAAGAPAELRVEVTRVDAEPAGAREAGEPVELVWTVPRDSSTDATIRLREGGTCGGSMMSFCKGIYVVENTGTVPLETLKIRVRFGASGAKAETYAVAGHARALRPGEREPFRIIRSVDSIEDTQPWTFEVIQVDSP